MFILSTGSNEAEMMTSQGAIYKTVNGGLNWKAQVKETIDATLNRVSSSGTSGASYFNGKVSNQVQRLFIGDLFVTVYALNEHLADSR